MADETTKKPHRITVRLSTRTIEHVESIAEREDRKVGAVVRRLLEQALRPGAAPGQENLR